MAKLTVESAKAFLKSKGYYTDNLWGVDDVQNKYNCTDEQAQEVLNDVFTGEWVSGEINVTIGIVADIMGLKEIEDEE